MILDGAKAIRDFLERQGVTCGKARLRGLVRAGAPIRVQGKGDGRRYTADDEELRKWFGPPSSR